MKNKIITILSSILGAIIGAGIIQRKNIKIVSKKNNIIDKNDEILKMFAAWIQNNQEGKSLIKYFEDNNYLNIAIYGMGIAGKLLYGELRNSKINISYAIDKNAERIQEEYDIFTLEDDLSKVDAVIVTAIHYFNEVEEDLLDKVSCPIISLEDIVYEL